MEYNFRAIEKKWQEKWQADKAYKVSNISTKPKYYVLDMFPYPSGAGLHVGHPLGYIASDIYSRYKRLKGFNVLHPMGYDAFGLPAEQYAIEHGIHPEISTANNINNFRAQLDKIGFCYDWDREVNTSKPQYYKWTQWIFLQLFNSFYNKQTNKAEKIENLIAAFEKDGSVSVNGQRSTVNSFTAEEWKAFEEKTQQDILMEFRLAYCGYGEVNWCEALGTVLANDEVVNGVSERGGHPVVKKKLRQWYLRITDYANRLLEGLDKVEFSDAMKEMQTNWIGKSSGAEISFSVNGQPSTVNSLTVYTTRPDTIFGVDFMVIAPEHELIESITTTEQQQAVEEYLTYVKSKSDRERQAEKKITGCFTGAYAINPFDGREIPIWISEYVLIGYGTGAIMAVPCGDERDFKFANHFNIPITNIIGSHYNGEEANPTKDAILENSGFLNGLKMRDAIEVAIDKLEALGIGTRKTNFKMRDAAFSRQRYWGEPFPIVWKNGIAYPLNENELPLELPKVESYSPGPDGEGPLANIPEWVERELETNTMPGYAGSSWYFLRYMDNENNKEFVSKQASDYWNQVDVYIGGTEHAVGHLLYSRMWTKALYDLGFISFDEPFKKLVNQGMITGISDKIYRKGVNAELGSTVKSNSIKGIDNFGNPVQFPIGTSEIQYCSEDYVNHYGDKDTMLEEYSLLNVPIEFVNDSSLNVEKLLNSWVKEKHGIFLCKDGFYYNNQWLDYKQNPISTPQFKTVKVVEKMSKSKLNVENPNDVIEKYGADTFRMYEMFLGPVEQSKPWDTKGIEGVHRFLKKLWRLFYTDITPQSPKSEAIWNKDTPTAEELKVLHKTIKKIEEDTERFSYNTAVSAFMVCVNELADLKCNKKEVLEPLLILLVPYAPHITEELWAALGNTTSILDAAFPTFNASYLVESVKEYPVSINGKMRTTLNFPVDAEQKDIEPVVLENDIIQKWLEGKAPKKIIFVKGKMINVVM